MWIDKMRSGQTHTNTSGQEIDVLTEHTNRQFTERVRHKNQCASRCASGYWSRETKPKMPGWTLLLVALVTCLVVSVDTQSSVAKDFKYEENEWLVASEFLLTYHSQWPIRRMIGVYHVFPGFGERHTLPIY